MVAVVAVRHLAAQQETEKLVVLVVVLVHPV
jgi:hypothetical protein